MKPSLDARHSSPHAVPNNSRPSHSGAVSNANLPCAAMAWLACVAATAVGLMEAQTPEIVEIGPHHRVIETVSWEMDSAGDPVGITNRYTELATGMHFLADPRTGRWEESREVFEVTREGYAIAVQGNHKVILAPNINQGGSVDLELPDGQRLISNPMGLAFVDRASGRSVLLAEVKDCVGTLVADNVVLYEDCFDDLNASLRYTYTRAGFEQFVILHEHPGFPEDYGMDPETTTLEMFTEFFDPPQPEVRGAIERDGLEDSDLDFGSMRMGPGLAYTDETDPLEGIRILKSWESIEGRQFLIEAVPYLEAEPFLETLDLVRSIQPPGRWVPNRSGLAGLLARRGKQPDAGHFIARAGAGAGRPGFTLDYSVLDSTLNNMVFRGDETYYCSGLTHLYETTRIEGGTVVKYANTNSAELRFHGPVLFETSACRPAFFIARDDDSVGQTISGSSGNPTNNYSPYALRFWNVSTPVTIQHIRVSHANFGMVLYAPSGHVVQHVQFVRCSTPIGSSGNSFTTRNLLMHHAATRGFHLLSGSTATGENLTLHEVAQVVNTSNALSLTNSLLVSVTNWTYSFYGANNATNSSSSAFQSVGAGHHYLAAHSPYRNAGTTNLSAGLLTQLRQRTTHPPILLDNVSVNTFLSPQATRDTGLPDLGYHYEPIDYIASNVLVSATLTLTNGVALGVSGSYGLRMQSSGRVASEGLPHVLNRVVSLANVQEQPVATGGNTFIDLPSGLYPIMEFRFTDLSIRQGALGTILANNGFNPFQLLSFQHCQIRGATLGLWPSTSSTVTATLLNNRLERSSLSFAHSYYSQNTPFYVSLYNNLFRNGFLYLNYDSGTYNPYWYVRDNLFDGTSQYLSGNAWGTYIQRGYNGFISGTTNSLGGSNNKTGLTADYQTGPLGPFYYPASGANLTQLINAGSRTASSAGLYHFTTTTNQFKEATSTVDIGYHYVAVDGNGFPVDTDGDGLPDYFEDRNGNGTFNTGETDWQTSENGTTGIPGLQIHPPLE
jgi:hypothetical protein